MTISRADASRMNGAQSSGPVSEEGKARSSQNALKQGLFSKRRLLDDEDPEEFRAFKDSLLESLQPVTAVEHVLIDRMAMARWRLGRLERAEAARVEIERNSFTLSMEIEKWRAYGGPGLACRVPQLSEESLKPAVADRDRTVIQSLSVPIDFEKYVKLSAALNREFDGALREFRAEQSRRVDSLELQSVTRRERGEHDSAISSSRVYEADANRSADPDP
jgi:hypothetical protein